MNVHFSIQVPRSPELNQMIQRLTLKLEPLLLTFNPELVQLHGRLVRHTGREGVICTLNLRLPTAQFAAGETASTAQTACHAAGAELISQLHRHMQTLRDTRGHRRRPVISHAPRHLRYSGIPPEVAAGFRQSMAGYFDAHQRDLTAFVRRQILLREHLGELSPGQMDPREVFDEIVVRALSSDAATFRLNRHRWMTVLAADAIRDLAALYGSRRHGEDLESLDQDVAVVADDPLPAAPASLRSGTGPGEGPHGAAVDGESHAWVDLLSSDEANPEQLTYSDELLAALRTALRPLPSSQRHDLVLFLLEGFTAEELALVSHRTVQAVRRSLRQAEEGVRRDPNLPDYLKARLQRHPVPSFPPERRTYASG